jgi:very-short-patch-repair endonuclease
MSEEERRHQGPDETAHEPLVDRAVRLFEFLGRSQQLRNQPARDVDSYRRDGAVLWLKDLPHHAALDTALRQGEPAVDDPLITVERVPRSGPPVPDDQLREWLDGPLDDPETVPTLRASVFVVDDAVVEASVPPALRSVALEERPEITELFGLWMQDWRPWALQERRDSPVRSFYGELFSIYVTAAGHPEELELVVGVGCLAWAPDGHPAVRRHLLTAPVSVHFEDDTGQLSVTTTESSERISVEIDMLDPGLITNPQHVNDVRERARDLVAHPLHRDESGALVRRIVHTLAPDAEYRDVDEIGAGAGRPIAAFAPAIILRKRSQRGLVEIFRTIVAQLKDSNSVPEGVLPLIDPDHCPQVDAGQSEGERDDGALVRVDGDPFLPLPVNDVQLRILRQVDSYAQTLVQGPPGTGKTHTAAALISHLLAEGKRVLVTAHTDRALKEVRAKLPEAIQPLAVAVVGTSREDMSDLRVAVERIAATAADYDGDDAALVVARTLDRIDELRRRRAAVYRDLLSAREHEVHVHEFAGYRGTLATIAQQHDIDSARLGWLEKYVAATHGPAPLGNVEILEWRALLIDDGLRADEAEARRRLLDVSCLPDARTFADLVQAEARAVHDDARLGSLRGHHAFDLVSGLDDVVREELRSRLHQLADEIDSLSGRPETWMREALSDTQTGRASLWEARGQELSALIARAAPLVQQLGSVTDIAAAAELGRLVPLAIELQEYVAAGGRIKPGAGGMPKIGPFTARQVKQAQPLFEAVRVDGAPPTAATQLHAFLIWAEGVKTLAAMDRAWPAYVAIPLEDTLRERLQWHVRELAQLRRVLGVAAELGREEERLRYLGLPLPDWNDLSAIRTYADLVDAAAAADGLAAARAPLDQLQQQIAREAHWSDAAPAVHELLQSVTRRDHEGYFSAMTRLHRLSDVRRAVGRRDELGDRLAAHAPLLCSAITGSPHDGDWTTRIDAFTEAWTWAAAGTWIRERKALDVNALQAEVTLLEQEIRTEVEILAATRAWNHAVGADRLSRGARASLEQYAYLVRRLGKGTGKYQVLRKAEIRQAMDRCRPAVPVWILPIYRIADQLRIQPDMFDVVIVDEASQAGLEATFLQYLAPRIVVIGDDKQVSPSAVGVDQQQLRDLAAQYLHDDPYRSSWQDPQRSLFDEAKMRFSGMLTLVEHRRCVPEIIGFSNRIAYEPDGIRLIPMRQYGADRLEPIKTVFLAEGYERGSAGNKINQVEVEAIVDQVVACIADPRYDGRTLGVISLLGQPQAKVIEKKLLDAITPEEWTARQLRCGDAADFQGSERDVMFLSMVAAPEPGKRSVALTQDLYMQRYNVAASRAKDQMWIFHSIDLNDLGNPQDMRFQLLDYCYGVQRRSHDDDRVLTAPVPEDVRVRPFDSLFEQRMCNRLIDRGHTVIPQYPVEGYRLDLVVVGAKARLAIECDGDAWHGPDAYQRDMARQRELERCGWNFFRVRESDFYVDKAAALAGLWEALAKLDIHPSGWISDQPDDLGFPDPDPGQEPDPDTESRTHAGPEPELEPARHPMEPPGVDAQNVVPAVTRPPGPAQDRLGAYRPFTDALLPVTIARPSEIIEGLVAITAAEGPILGHRLHNVYVKAAGGQRVGLQIAKVLNSAIHAALCQGLLAEDDPLGELGVRARTFRLPNQKAVIVRYLGPRTLEQVPPSELAKVMWHAGERVGWDDQDRLFRATLAAYGLKRLTPNVISRLRAVWSLARPQPPP